MTDPSYVWGKTPTGSKIHCVGTQESMLARGTRNASNHSSACGTVPDTWETNVSDPSDPSEVCQRCAESLLKRGFDLPADTHFMRQAAGQVKTDGSGYPYDDMRVTDYDPATDTVEDLQSSLQQSIMEAQEDAFVQGVGRGYREGTKQLGLSRWLQQEIAQSDGQRRAALIDVQHWLADHGCRLWRGEGWDYVPVNHGLILTPQVRIGGDDGGT